MYCDWKGQCHEIFCFWFFSWISFPPAPEYPIRTVSNFLENSRRYSQVKVHHQYQRHRWQILPLVSLVLLIPVANLPPVSTIPAANLPPVSTTCQQHRWQTMGTISGCRHLKWTWRQKFINMLTLLSKVSQQNYLNFSDWRFFSFATANLFGFI